MSARPTDARLTGALGEKLRGLRGLARHARRTLGMAARLDRALVGAIIGCQVVDALALVAIAWVGKHLVDAIVATLAMPSQRDPGPAMWWVVVELFLVASRAIAGQLDAYFQLMLRSKLDVHVNVLILEKAARVSFERFEDSEFVDAMTRARNEASFRPFDLLVQSLSLGRHVITLIGFSILIASLGPWAILVLFAAAVPPFVAQAKHGRATFALQRSRTTRTRRAAYVSEIMTGESTAKEVKLFGLARWLIDLYADIRFGLRAEEVALASSRARLAVALSVLSTIVLYATYGVAVLRTVAGAISLGSLTLYLLVLRQGQSTLQSALTAIARAYEANLFISTLYDYLEVEEGEPEAALAFDADDTRSRETPPRIELRNVSFRYPGSTVDALRDVSLDIASGETIALVGRNGAGKTTLIKLLVGLHRPTAGAILIDGVDTASIPVVELRRRVGVIFQDFARLHLTAGDNIGVGWLPLRTDVDAIRRAARAAGAAELIERLPGGLSTPLGRAFGGDELSIGQWQRVALARAFMRKSRILVLDEPTAAMDAEAEHEIFQRFRDLKASRTALLITHRLSTAQMADRVVVFDAGHVVEQGTHDQLMTANGNYAELFRLHAAVYSK